MEMNGSCPVCPLFEMEDGRYFPLPEAMVQMLVSACRDSGVNEMSDKEIASFICFSLEMLMRSNNLILMPYDGDGSGLMFKPKPG